MSARTKPRNRPLACTVTRNGVLRIEIGVETLAHTALHGPCAYEMLGENQTGRPDERFAISSARGFAVDVRRALRDEIGEDGSTLLTNVIDAAARKAIEDGSQFFVDGQSDPEEYAAARKARRAR